MPIKIVLNGSRGKLRNIRAKSRESLAKLVKIGGIMEQAEAM